MLCQAPRDCCWRAARLTPAAYSQPRRHATPLLALHADAGDVAGTPHAKSLMLIARYMLLSPAYYAVALLIRRSVQATIYNAQRMRQEKEVRRCRQRRCRRR